MKLLSSQAKKADADREEALKKLRKREIDGELNEKKHLLNVLNVDFDEAMKAQRDAYATEKEKHLEWRVAQKEEVEELERRREIALLPFTELEEQLKNKEASLAERHQALEHKEISLDETRESLEQRLDEVMDRELQVERLEITLQNKKQGIDAQTESVKEQSLFLTKALERFSSETSAKQKEIEEQKVLIEAREENIYAQTVHLQNFEKELFVLRKRLVDREATLERALERLKLNTI